MRLLRVEVEGLRSVPAADLSPADGVSALPDPRTAAAVADALVLARAVLRRDPAPALAALDLGDTATPDDPEPTAWAGASDLDPAAVRALAHPGAPDHVRIHLTVEPDPPLFRQLRDAAVHDPQLTGALADTTLAVSVGWLFTPRRDAASLDPLSLHVGDTRVSVHGADRPRWLPALFDALGARLHVLDTPDPRALAARWHDALTAPDPARRDRAARAADTLAHPPFSVGRLAVVRDGGRTRLAAGSDLVPLRALGPVALNAAALVLAACVDAPDLLVVRAPLPPSWAAWLAAEAVDCADATVVQVLHAPEPA